MASRLLGPVLKFAPIAISVCALGISWKMYLINTHPRNAVTHAIPLGVGRCNAPQSDKFYVDVAVVNTGEANALITNLSVGLYDKPIVQGERVLLFRIGSEIKPTLPDCSVVQHISPFLLRPGESVTERVFAPIRDHPDSNNFAKNGIRTYANIGYCQIDHGFNRHIEQYLGILEFDKNDLSVIGLSDYLRNPRMYAESTADVSCGPEINETLQLMVGYKSR